MSRVPYHKAGSPELEMFSSSAFFVKRHMSNLYFASALPHQRTFDKEKSRISSFFKVFSWENKDLYAIKISHYQMRRIFSAYHSFGEEVETQVIATTTSSCVSGAHGSYKLQRASRPSNSGSKPGAHYSFGHHSSEQIPKQGQSWDKHPPPSSWASDPHLDGKGQAGLERCLQGPRWGKKSRTRGRRHLTGFGYF